MTVSPKPRPALEHVVPVLLVDDSANMRTILRRLLQSIGIEDVVDVGSAAYAMAALKSREFRFVISDIEMEGGNGFELVKVMRNAPALATIPVLLITASLRTEHVETAKSLSLTSMLLKPFSSDTLERKIADLAVWRARNTTAVDDETSDERSRVSRWTQRG